MNSRLIKHAISAACLALACLGPARAYDNLPIGASTPLPIDETALNGRLEDLTHPDALPEGFRAAFPRVEVEEDGMRFVVRPDRYIAVRGADPDAPAPTVEVGRKVPVLCFLHAFTPGRGVDEWRRAAALAKRQIRLVPEPPEVFAYVVEYEDGSTLRIPVRWREGVEDWFRTGTVGPMLWARAAWIERLDRVSTEQIALYAMKWPNPRPDLAIARVTVERAGAAWDDLGDALVFALSTAEPLTEAGAWYVAPAPLGADDHPGTFDAPFATIERGVEALAPGDTLYLRGGTFPLTRKVVITKSGRPDGWITISAFPGETPKLDGMYALLDPRLQPFDPEGEEYDWDTGLIAIAGADHVRVQGLQVRNSRRSGLSAYGVLESRAEGIEFLFNSVYKTFGQALIIHHVDDVRVIGNTVCKALMSEMAFLAEGMHEERIMHYHPPQEDIDLSRNDRFEVAYNEVYGGQKEGIDGISVADGEIHHNYIHHKIAPAIYLDSWSTPNHHVRVWRNWVHAASPILIGTEGGGAVHHVEIHHNLVYDNLEGGIGISESDYKAPKISPFHDVRAFNNTVFRNGYKVLRSGGNVAGMTIWGFREGSQMQDIGVFNNIVAENANVQFVSNLTGIEDRNFDLSHNLLHPLRDDRPERVREGHPAQMLTGEAVIDAAPRFTDPERGDFTLRPDSPAIGAARPDPDHAGLNADRNDLGAIPFGTRLREGLDWSGRVLFSYTGPTAYTPVDIPRRLLNAKIHATTPDQWLGKTHFTENLWILPAGEQVMAGVTFFVPDPHQDSRNTVMTLKGRGSYSDEESITGIPVGRAADELCFLQTYHPADPDMGSAEVFHYVVHYADPSVAPVRIPVVYGEHIGPWKADEIAPPSDARIAWSAQTNHRGDWKDIALYAMCWKNPHPDVSVETIDIVSANTGDKDLGAPAVFAITTGVRTGSESGPSGQGGQDHER